METTVLKTTAENRENWLSNRQGKIGGSTIAAILGLDERRTPVDVWMDLTGKSSREKADNKATMRGQMMEQTVANFFEMETGLKIIQSSDGHEMYIHPTFDYLVASPDRRYWKEDGTKGVLECKTTRYMVSEIPEKWFVQLMWYIGFLAYEHGTIGWFEFPTESFQHQQFTFNKEFFDFLIGEAIEFHDRYIKTDTPPPIVKAKDVDRLFRKHVTGKVAILPDEMIQSHYVDYVRLSGEIREREAKLEALKDELKLLCRDAEAIENDGTILFTFKASKESMRFDTDAFAKSHPDLFSKFMRPTAGQRKFLVKAK